MKEHRLNDLIDKYLRNDLLPLERQRLKRMMLSCDEREIEHSLDKVWETYNSPLGRNQEAYDHIKVQMCKLLSEKKKRSLNISLIWKVASVALLIMALISITYYTAKEQAYNRLSENEVTIATQPGERITLTLCDGTKVTLNSETSFSYSASYGLTDRHVNLSGEAHFEVIHSSEQPFIVKTPTVHIKVLGTMFNVNAYPNNGCVETSLIEGQVQLFAANDYVNTMILLPNETGHFNTESNKFTRKKTDVRVELGWKRGDLVFRSATLEEIFYKVGKFYGITICINGTLPKESFTGGFHQEEITNVIKNLQAHYSFTYEKKGNELIVYMNSREK